MDVTCDRCGTVYEFDETLLSGRGTPVKCTNCGHMFKVYPKAAEGADRTTSSWRLRMRDGSMDTIDSMGELQRRINAGELTPDDEISRGDEDWKKLGTIRDLERLFVEAGIEVPDGRIPSPIPPVAPPQTSKDSSLPPGNRPRQPTLLGVSPVQRIAAADAVPEAAAVSEPVAAPGSVSEPVAAPGSVSASEPAAGSVSESVSASAAESEPAEAPVSAGGSYQSPYRDSFPNAAPVEIEDAEFEERPRGSTSVRASTPPPAYYDDDADIPELPGRGKSPLRWLLLIVVVGGLALVAAQWDRVARLVGIGSDPALIAAGIVEGDAAVAEGHPAAYANAIEAYGRAVEAGGEVDVEVLAKLSNAYALAAQAQIDGGAAGDGIGNLTAAATSTAETASELNDRDLDVKLAVVDAHRLAAKNTEARELLEEVRAISFSRTAEFFRVDARLSQAEAGGRLENGLRSARQAAELDPAGIRYSLLLVRAELAAGSPERAREALQTILEDQPEHPVASALMAEMEADEAAAEADAEPATEAEPTAQAEPETEAPPATESAPEPAAAKPAAEPAPAKAKAAAKPAAKAAAKPKRRKPVTKKPEYDEYDRLAQAAGSDAFVDGRPPVLDYESNMKKGREELEAGKYARARAYFDSALEVHPGSADAMSALGDVATAVSDYGSALRYYRVAAQRGHPDGYFDLGQTYERLGRNEEAVSAYYTYVKRRPTGKHAAAARTAIKTLEPRAKLPPEPETEPPPEPGATPEPDPSVAEEPAQESEPASP